MGYGGEQACYQASQGDTWGEVVMQILQLLLQNLRAELDSPPEEPARLSLGSQNHPPLKKLETGNSEPRTDSKWGLSSR